MSKCTHIKLTDNGFHLGIIQCLDCGLVGIPYQPMNKKEEQAIDWSGGEIQYLSNEEYRKRWETKQEESDDAN